MRTWKSLTLLLLMLVFIVGCTQVENTPKATLEKEQKIRPELVPMKNLDKLKKDMIPVVVDPQNQDIVYYMKMTDKLKDNSVIMGGYHRRVNLYAMNTKDNKIKEIQKNIEYITLAKWSFDGKYLGFISGNTLYIYDKEKEELINGSERANSPSSVYFGWSPDSKTIYTEHVNLPNDIIYNVLDKSGAPAYRVANDIPYYKGYYKENTYLGTMEMGNRTSITVLVDDKGKVVKRLSAGRFRDSYKDQLLQVGKDHFGLMYIPNMEEPVAEKLTDEYIYQTAFTPQGEIIYTTSGQAGKIPTYQLHIAGFMEEEMIIEVSGPYFTIWPDGRYIDIGGYGEERIDLKSYKKMKGDITPLIAKQEHLDLVETMVGGAKTYLDLYYGSAKSEKELENSLNQYYINTDEPISQWALFDYYNELANRKNKPYGSKYYVKGILEDLQVKEDRATIKANFGVMDDFGSGWGFGTTYELIKKEDRWYITGLSTFPKSKERQRVEKEAKDFIEKAQKGKRFSFESEEGKKLYENIKNKELSLGQIQFWRMSEPHISPDIATANYAKVYIKDKDKVYKLILNQKAFKAWKIINLSDKNLNGLF